MSSPRSNHLNDLLRQCAELMDLWLKAFRTPDGLIKLRHTPIEVAQFKVLSESLAQVQEELSSLAGLKF